MLLRVRLPDGRTVRVSADGSGEMLAGNVLARVRDLGAVTDPISLHADARFSAEFDFDRVSTGDMIFVSGAVVAEEEKAADSKAADSADANAAGDGAEKKEEGESEWRPPCRCGPRGMCEACMPPEDKRTRYQRELEKWRGRGMSIAVMEALEALKFKVKPQEEAHVSAAVVDSAAAKEFQAYLAKTSFSQQRLAIAYGKYDAAEKETHVHALYEPPQAGSADTYELLDGDEAGDMSHRAAALARMLGLQCVGVVLSARERKCILSAKDVSIAARLIADLPEEARKNFVVLLVEAADAGQTSFEAYQVSDQLVEMHEAGVLVAADKQRPNGGRLATQEDVFVEGKETQRVPTEFFILNVPIKPGGADAFRVAFPVENRDIAPQSPADVRRVMSAGELPYGQRLADFHLLLFLSSFFDMATDMPGLADAVRARSDDVEDGFRLMIDSMGVS